jgi:murein DD-endopeptidase MepM/ murein hydrolase activator NlpD
MRGGDLMFGSPVSGRIRPPGSPVRIGRFRVTSTFDEHVASGRGEGVDIGNGRCGAPIFAIADGEVTFADKLGNALVVRIAHPQFPGHESGYAHLASIARGIKFRAPVSRGQRIGRLGMTGADACHLHLGLKLNGVEIDSWPLIEQNLQAGTLKGRLVRRIVNRQAKALGDGTRLRPSPGTADPPLAEFPAGTVFMPDFLVMGGLANKSRRWYGGWAQTLRGTEFGYISETVLGQLRRIEKASD